MIKIQVKKMQLQQNLMKLEKIKKYIHLTQIFPKRDNHYTRECKKENNFKMSDNF